MPVYVAETAEQAISDPEESMMMVYKRLAAQADGVKQVRNNLEVRATNRPAGEEAYDLAPLVARLEEMEDADGAIRAIHAAERGRNFPLRKSCRKSFRDSRW